MRDREPAPAKVNLCLYLGATRSDGRHELVTLFESVTLCDELELEVASEDEVVCPGVEGPNLVETALQELRARGWSAPPVRFEITKRIPVAAGLGGGSADAAAALRLARRLEPVPEATLAEIAAGLGADVPSQLEPGVAVGTGAGDQVARRGALAEHAFVIIPQPARLSTADVYREADRLGLPRGGGELEALRDRLEVALGAGEEVALGAGEPLHASMLGNDLQPAALSLCPQVAGALEAARGAGAAQAMVCGSGPTVIGVFWGPRASSRAEGAAARLAERFPGVAAARPISSWPCGTI